MSEKEVSDEAEVPGRSSSEPVYFDSHMHTPLCKHAYGQPIAYARNGMRRGLKGIIMTCHSPMPDGFSSTVRMDPEEFPEYVALVRDSAEQLERQWIPNRYDATVVCVSRSVFVVG